MRMIAIGLLLTLCVLVGAQDKSFLPISADQVQVIMARYKAMLIVASEPDITCTQADLEAWVTGQWHWNDADWDWFNRAAASGYFDPSGGRDFYFTSAAEQMGYTCDR